jgi:hypothetical protein
MRFFRHVAAVLGFIAVMAMAALPASAQAVIGSGIWGDIKPLSSYTGPGDIVSGATAWYGLRAYNAAYATGSNNAVNYRRASDNSTQNGVILSNGKFDIATANTFAGTDATCTGSASASTSLSLTSCSSTPHAGSTLTSTGGTGSFTQPVYIVSCGSFAGGAGTCTLNTAQTVTGVSVTAQYGLYVTELYDQSGNSHHVTQATAGNQPSLLPSCGNSLPCIYFPAGQSLTVASYSLTQPFTISMALNGLNLFSNKAAIGIGSNIIIGSGGSNQGKMYAGTNATLTTSGIYYASQSVFNGASSVWYLNGSSNSVSPGTNGNAGTFGIGQDGFSDNCAGCTVLEVGVWNGVAFSAGNNSSMNSNQRTYWGF